MRKSLRDDVRVVDGCGRDALGEGITWSSRRDSILWVDILVPALRSYCLATEKFARWSMPELIGWAVEREGRDDFLIGLQSGFAALSLDPFQISAVLDPEPERPHNRLNDAKVDLQGRLWAGSKDHRDQEPLGALYSLDGDLTCTRHDDGYQVTNGPTFSPDGSTLYHTDSSARTIFAFDLDGTGALTNKRSFIQFERSWGYPDGMTTDVGGNVWVAHWGGSRVSCFSSEGCLLRSIPFPTSQITNCAFAGPRLDRLFVTSAASGLPHDTLAGALFEVEVGTTGMAPVRFAG